MKHFMIWTVRLYPFWSIPIIAILYQLAVHYRRRGSSTQWIVTFIGAFLGILVLFWAFFRGDLNSDQWVRFFFE